ncbi:cleavage and polyadenylation specificity factor subunit 3-II isoform X5 [Magnolia sinica]|uniref:cleavage and polyadenylation specificity factor subunit 3-II isoform X5 n=1 Tax=Magnolia sinica TaxID=86752 RepID=UPI0026595556|nr:cleavage and polyadenylation specificity factor subunit 3-II isoform X5 [Magnolia sinica]
MAIECLVLGAGQEVGKSCVVVSMGGKKIMFDCGMHMGYTDRRCYPDFSLISSSDFDNALTCIVITHFHLDHIGALPYFTEVCGYRGPIYMTYPTKALAPMMLEDYRKLMVDRRGEKEVYTSNDITECMKKVIAVDLKQTVQVDKDLQIRAYYAGHVHKCVAGGGKVLIPAFALGRAQELCMLLDDYWERMNLKFPIYFSAGLTIQANMYYKMLIGWTSQKVKDAYVTRSAFDFKHVQTFDRSLLNAPGPCVLFATPGMITGGFSLEVFKQWAPSEMNLVTLPGYSVAGTIGHKLMAGKPTRVTVDKDTYVDVRCQIHQLSFSPHTDGKGIMDLVRFLSPKHVILVHGEKPKMDKLKGQIESELGIQCCYPANNETVQIPTTQVVKIEATKSFIRNSMSTIPKCLNSITDGHLDSRDGESLPLLQIRDERVTDGILIMEKTKRAKVVYQDELLQTLGVEEHKVQFAYCCPVCISSLEQIQSLEPSSRVTQSILLDSHVELNSPSNASTGHTEISSMESVSADKFSWIHQLFLKLKYENGIEKIQEFSDHLQLESFVVHICSNDDCPYRSEEVREGRPWIFFCCSWSLIDEKLAWRMLSIMKILSS